jgi:hypothetical protein
VGAEEVQEHETCSWPFSLGNMGHEEDIEAAEMPSEEHEEEFWTAGLFFYRYKSFRFVFLPVLPKTHVSAFGGFWETSRIISFTSLSKKPFIPFTFYSWYECLLLPEIGSMDRNREKCPGNSLLLPGSCGMLCVPLGMRPMGKPEGNQDGPLPD